MHYSFRGDAVPACVQKRNSDTYISRKKNKKEREGGGEREREREKQERRRLCLLCITYYCFLYLNETFK